MKLRINGKEVETYAKTLGELIKEKNIPQFKVAIEVDGQVIPKSQLDNYILKEHSAVEIITFVGGG
jgi:thiamine biosynthesis protein ThiS